MSKIENSAYIYFNENQIKKSNDKNKNNKTIFGGFESRSKFNTLISELETSSIQMKERAKIEEEISLLQRELGMQGEILKKSNNINDLDLYKKLVKKYLNAVITLTEKVEVKAIRNLHKYKKEKEKNKDISLIDIKPDPKIYISIIDKELYELTREFLKEQREVFKIASKIDRIEGILVNLFS